MAFKKVTKENLLKEELAKWNKNLKTECRENENGMTKVKKKLLTSVK